MDSVDVGVVEAQSCHDSTLMKECSSFDTVTNQQIA
jgi:hypothetical protein